MTHRRDRREIRGKEKLKRGLSRFVRWAKASLRSRQDVFNRIYNLNRWRDSESASGSGSRLESTEVIREELPRLLKKYGVRTLLDAPCGDFNWMKTVELDVDEYIGIDIVEELVETNRRQFSSDTKRFIKLDVVSDKLPSVDCIFCRDCLVHLSLNEAKQTIQNVVKSGAEYFISTTFPQVKRNVEIFTGEWHPLNLCKKPFLLPKPIELVVEQFISSDVGNKCIGVWKVSDLLQ